MSTKPAKPASPTTSKAERRSKGASRRRSPVKPQQAPQQGPQQGKAKPQQAKAKPQQGPQEAPQQDTANKGPDGLSDQQRQFYRLYRLTHNATQSAIECGYSAKTAQQQASKLLRHPVIQAMLRQDTRDEQARFEDHVIQVRATMGITVERTLLELARLAFFDVRKLYKANGDPIKLSELDDDTAAAIAGLDVQELFGGTGDDRTVIGHVKKWKLADKSKALDMLMKHQNLYKADNEGKGGAIADQLAEFLAGIHATGSKLPVREPGPAQEPEE